VVVQVGIDGDKGTASGVCLSSAVFNGGHVGCVPSLALPVGHCQLGGARNGPVHSMNGYVVDASGRRWRHSVA
jgi:hypothetical protein